jgi:hypothetical protein
MQARLGRKKSNHIHCGLITSTKSRYEYPSMAITYNNNNNNYNNYKHQHINRTMTEQIYQLLDGYLNRQCLA